MRGRCRGVATPLARFGLGGPAAAFAILCAPAAAAQDAEARPKEESKPEIVVVGERGSAVKNIEPIVTLDVNAIMATGATTMPELLRAIRGQTQSADGSEPIFLLNSQRVSGYQDIGSLPPEAILKVEVLPEQAALQFGFPPTRRVVNFITKPSFRQIEAKASAGTTTRLGSGTEKANLGLTRLQNGGRLSLTLEVRHTDPVHQSDRSVVPDPDIPFDAIGNVLGVGGEIDPALSALVGHAVTIAAVPEAVADRTTLAGYAPGTARQFDLGPYRTLSPRNDAVKGEVVVANRIGKTLAGSISLSAEQSRDRTISGPADAMLLVPGSNPFSPFAGPVLLARYLTEVDPLRQRTTTTTLHAGFTLRGSVAGWRWDLTAALDQKQVDSRNERGVDPAAANAAIAAGANPFAPLDPSLLAPLVDHSRQRTRTAGAKMVATNTPIRLPAGRVSVNATIEVERASAESTTRGANPFELRLARTRTEGAVAIDVPLASRREGVLPFVGELSVNASLRARNVGGFGGLHEATYGLAWAPITGVQMLATIRQSAAAPDMAQQSTPVSSYLNVPVFDFGAGRTVLATLIQGGNPDLEAEHRLVHSLAINIKPFKKQEWRIGATYETTVIRNQTGTVYALTPQTEAILPELFVRDSGGQLVSVAIRPINFSLERQRTLNFNLTLWGRFGKPLPPRPGAPPGPPAQWTYYGGMGPTIKFSDRLQLRPGTPEFDLLKGDTVTGGGSPSAFGYFYGGLNYLGNGMNIDGWYGGANRVRNANPASDLRFSPIFKLNMAGYISVHHFLKHEAWTSHMQLRLEVNNATDARQRVRDGNGNLPNRLQPDLLDPIGRTVTLSLRKLF